MDNNEKRLDIEEDFFSQDRKETRKERKNSQLKDRSKYKKSDQDQRKNREEKGEPLLGANCQRGRVLNVTLDGIKVSSEHKTFFCSLKGALKKEKSKHKNLIAVGDFVHFDPSSSTITHIEKRTSFLSRTDNLSRRKQQLMAVNIDQVFIVMSLVFPKFKPLLIDRYIIAANKGNMDPIIIINKIDLLDDPPPHILPSEVEEEKRLFEEFLTAYSPLGIPILQLSASNHKNLDRLKEAMQGKTSVFAGQSGVGKSSLINVALGIDLAVGDVIEKTRKGSHTTSTAQLLSIEGEGFCIDTPGIKSFGMWDLPLQEIPHYFDDFFPFSEQCKFPNCTHLHEPDCGVKQALETGEIHRLRYASYVTLMSNEPIKEWE